MSGFAAVFDRAPEGSSQNLRDPRGIAAAMSAALAHRGELSHCAALSGGRAAVTTRDYAEGVYRTLVEDNEERAVVFDGFLFNETELCARFRTDSLGEAIWRLFRAEGNNGLAALDGSFALVIHDRRRGGFYLARDRFGHRPLMLAIIGDQVVCASEAKAFFAHPGFTRRLNHDVLPRVLGYGLELGPETLIEGVIRCQPGHVAEIGEDGALAHHLFFRPRCEIEPERTLDSLAEKIDRQLSDIVVSYARRCPRLGVFLSSGTDSVLLAGKLADHAELNARAVSFGAQGWAEEESTTAQKVADQLGLPFTRAWADGDFDVLSHLHAAVRHLEAPNRFENAIALEAASRAAGELRDGAIKAVMTGEGADDLFGDERGLRLKQLTALWRLPAWALDLGANTFGSLPGRWTQAASDHLRCRDLVQFLCLSYLWSPDLLAGHWDHPSVPWLNELDGAYGDLSPIHRLMLVNALGINHAWVERMERIGAAHGLDVVHPYINNRMLELSLTTPYRLMAQQGGKLLKPALRRLAAKRFGAELTARPKQQLAAPFALWLEESPGLREAVRTLGSQTCLFRAYVDAGAAERALRDFAAKGPANKQTMKTVFMLLNLELWLQDFIDEPASIAA